MSVFTEHEIEYLQAHRLGRLATVSAKGEPHVVPVGYQYNAALDTIDLGGGRGDFGESKKFRDAQATGKAALVVDDVAQDADGQRQIRGIEIRGISEAHETGFEQLHPGMDPAFIRLRPTRIISWGINHPGYSLDARDVNVPAR